MTRKPAAFRVDVRDANRPEAPVGRDDGRQPSAHPPDAATLVPAEVDVFAEPDPSSDLPVAASPRRRFGFGKLFAAAVAALISLAVCLWADRLIAVLFQRSATLGWLASGLAVIAAAALLALLVREIGSILRLASVDKLRDTAAQALSRNDAKQARIVTTELSGLLAAIPETAAGRRALATLEGEIVDGADLLRIAERELLAPLDRQAVALILEAAKRVSVVTAVSPRAFVDIAYVIFESGRLIRRLAELYGARPGTLGFLRLARGVLAHLAVTGAIAAGDDFVHQVVGQGLAARLSARLGEGVVNGMMTARIGIAAMETVRPLPFLALRRPGIGDFLPNLSALATRRKPPPAPV